MQICSRKVHKHQLSLINQIVSLWVKDLSQRAKRRVSVINKPWHQQQPLQEARTTQTQMKLDNKIVTNYSQQLYHRKRLPRKIGKASHNHQFYQHQQLETKRKRPIEISILHRWWMRTQLRNSLNLKMEKARHRTLTYQKLKRKVWSELNQRRWKNKLMVQGRPPWRNHPLKFRQKSWSHVMKWLYNASIWTSTDGTASADHSTRNHAVSPL